MKNLHCLTKFQRGVKASRATPLEKAVLELPATIKMIYCTALYY